MGASQNKPLKNWKLLYEAAVLECDRAKLLERIAEAEKAIAEEAVILMREGTDGVERHSLEDAMQVLEDLKRRDLWESAIQEAKRLRDEIEKLKTPRYDAEHCRLAETKLRNLPDTEKDPSVQNGSTGHTDSA